MGEWGRRYLRMKIQQSFRIFLMFVRGCNVRALSTGEWGRKCLRIGKTTGSLEPPYVKVFGLNIWALFMIEWGRKGLELENKRGG
jgi:hypothetical protein